MYVTNRKYNGIFGIPHYLNTVTDTETKLRSEQNQFWVPKDFS